MYLTVNSGGDVVVAKGDGEYWPLDAALTKFPDVCQRLVQDAQFVDSVFVKDKCFVSVGDFEFIVYVGETYPDQYTISLVEKDVARFGGKVTKRVFGDFYCTVGCEEALEAACAFFEKSIWSVRRNTTEEEVVVDNCEDEPLPDIDAIMSDISDQMVEKEHSITETDLWEQAPDPTVETKFIVSADVEEVVEKRELKAEESIAEEPISEVETGFTVADVEQNTVSAFEVAAEEPISEVEEAEAELPDWYYADPPYTVPVQRKQTMSNKYMFLTHTFMPESVAGVIESHVEDMDIKSIRTKKDCIDMGFTKRGSYYLMDVYDKGVRVAFDTNSRVVTTYPLELCEV